MNTRALEQKNVLRASVLSAEVLSTDKTSVTFKTSAVMTSKLAVSSADSEMLNQQHKARVGEAQEGRLRIDVVTDNILRIRFAEGGSVPTNDTPMVVGTPGPPERCVINTEIPTRPIAHAQPGWQDGLAASSRTGVEIATNKMRVVISRDPFRVEVYNHAGERTAGIGGPEKDNFVNWDSYNTGICRVPGAFAPIAVENFDLAYDEAIYGLGEQFIKLNKVGQTIDLDMVDALGVTTPRAYKNIPFFVSSKGYGVYFNHSSLMTYWLGSMSATDVQVAAEDDFLDYYVIVGDIKQVLSSYTDLTGKGSVPPPWSFGFWQSKISYSSAEETIDIAKKIREHQIPCDVIHLDTFWFKEDWFCNLEFAKDRFPDPKAYLAKLAEMGFKVSLWQLPYIPEGSKLYDDLKAVDGFVKNAAGEIYNCGVCFTAGFKGTVGVVDYTNPAAVKVHQQAFRDLFEMGAKVVKTDFGEAAPLDGVYHDGTPGHQMHNLYPLLYNKAVFEVTKETTGDGVVWARSAWAGSQRYPVHWGGDNTPNYFNMQPQMAGGLSFGLSGFQFWSHDIGGFCGNTSDELLIRWLQLGMFISHARIHGFGNRELYKFETRTLDICRDYLRMRYRLMPYIYSSSVKCVLESLPLARALVIEYQHDPTVASLGDEWLFGDNLLVAPIFDETGKRRVYLPKGIWTDWWNRERLAGERWIEAQADLATLPLWVREGGIVPLGPVLNYIGEKPVDELNVLIAPFEHDGTSHFDVHVEGASFPITYSAASGHHKVEIGRTNVAVTIDMLAKVPVQVVKG